MIVEQSKRLMFTAGREGRRAKREGAKEKGYSRASRILPSLLKWSSSRQRVVVDAAYPKEQWWRTHARLVRMEAEKSFTASSCHGVETVRCGWWVERCVART